MMSAKILHFPRPYTTSQDEIDAGLTRAGQMYSEARTDAERAVAVAWWLHWLKVADAVALLRYLGPAR